MRLTQAEIQERLDRAAEARRTIRRATIKLMELGQQALAARERARIADDPRRTGDDDDDSTRSS